MRGWARAPRPAPRPTLITQSPTPRLRSPPAPTFSVARLFHPSGLSSRTRPQHGVPHPCVPLQCGSRSCADARRIAALAFALALAPAVLADCDAQYDSKYVPWLILIVRPSLTCAPAALRPTSARALESALSSVRPHPYLLPLLPSLPVRSSDSPLTRPAVAIVFCLIFAAGLARRRRAARMQQAFRAQGVGAPSTGPVLTGTAWSQHVAGGPALPPTAYSGGYAPAYMAPVRLACSSNLQIS
jgi:hypothetical protein